MDKVYTPATLDEALRLLAGGAKPVAGCTDYLVRRKKGLEAPCDIVSLDRIDALRTVAVQGGQVCIGALATFAQLEGDARLPDALRAAAAQMGGPQIRNRATLGGNIATASPAADSLPPLLALSARLRLQAADATREIPLQSFLLGPGKTALAPGEVITAVCFDVPKGTTAFFKLGKRNALAISVVSLAAHLQLKDGLCTDIALAVGACGPTVIRPAKTEALLRGARWGADALEDAARCLEGELSPIDDGRATARYRRAVAGSILQQLLRQMTEVEHG